MAKATPVKLGGGGKPRGEFRIESFNLFNEEDQKRYAELRNREANRANGIEFEMVREYSRKSVLVEESSDDSPNSRITTTTEEVILVIHYWEKPVVRSKGDSEDEVQESKSQMVAR